MRDYPNQQPQGLSTAGAAKQETVGGLLERFDPLFDLLGQLAHRVEVIADRVAGSRPRDAQSEMTGASPAPVNLHVSINLRINRLSSLVNYLDVETRRVENAL